MGSVSKKQFGLFFGVLAIFCLINLVNALVIDSVFTSPDEIVPGESSEVEIKLRNNGNTDIEDVSVNLDLANVPFAPFDSSSEFGFDEIREDKSRSARFEIIALNDAKSGIYKIPVKITYIDEEILKTKNSLISLAINSKPVIGVSSEEDLLLKSQENELDITVINKGLGDIKFLEVEIGTSTYYSILGSRNFYIGDLDSDDFDSVGLKLFFKANAPNKMNLPIFLKYKDFTNKEYIGSFNIELNVYSREKAMELGLIQRNNAYIYIIVIIVLIILYIVYRKIKKRQRLKSSD